MGRAELLPVERATTLFAREPAVRLTPASLARAADTLGLAVRIQPEKRFASGSLAREDHAVIEVELSGERASYEVRLAARATRRELVGAGAKRARALGGGGMDALIEGSRFVLQIGTPCDGSAGAPLLGLAAVLSASYLAAILPADSSEPVIGAKTALARFERARGPR